MGFYRFILAIGVVAFHLGGASWIIGRVAVYCFYFVSGFLICRVLDTSYRGGIDRLGAFYGNRFLRLVPLLVVTTLLTMAIFTIHGSTSFVVGGGERIRVLQESLVGNFSSNVRDFIPLPAWLPADIPMLTGAATDAIPQSWSIGVEILFYLVAPILIVLAQHHVWPLAFLAVIATGVFLAASLSAPDFYYVDNLVYKNALTSAFMFFWGAVIYVVMRDTTLRIPFVVGAPIVALILYYFWAWSDSDLLWAHEKSRNVFIANILLALPLSAIVCLTVMPSRLSRWEQRLGNLSYGIYLNHFLVAGLLLWLAELVGSDLFGRYGQPVFGAFAIIACALFAALTFALVERPVEILRRKIKGMPAAEASRAESSAVSETLAAKGKDA